MNHEVASALNDRLRDAREERADEARKHTHTPRPPHWSSGPAKWFAVAVLGSATIGIASWSLWRRVPSPMLERSATQQPALAPAPLITQGLPSRASGPAITGLIDLNTADAAAFESLPGIGPTLAERIVISRTQLGAFNRLEDLDRVPGIGPKIIERLRPLVWLSAQPKP